MNLSHDDMGAWNMKTHSHGRYIPQWTGPYEEEAREFLHFSAGETPLTMLQFIPNDLLATLYIHTYIHSDSGTLN